MASTSPSHAIKMHRDGPCFTSRTLPPHAGATCCVSMEQSSTSNICEACHSLPSTISEPCDDESRPYRLCAACQHRLVKRALRPMEWYRLALRHCPYNFSLHDDFYLNDGNCSACSVVGSFPNCASVSSCSGSTDATCTACSSKYYLAGSTCVRCTDLTNCAQTGGCTGTTDTTCIQCISTYYVKAGLCSSCSGTGSFPHCTTVVSPFFLFSFSISVIVSLI